MPLHAEGLGSPRPWDSGQGLLQRGLLQAQGHLQEVDCHLEGLYFDHLVGLVSGENSSPTCRGKGEGSAVAQQHPGNPLVVLATGEDPLAHRPCTTAAPALVANGDGTSAEKGNLGHFGAFSILSHAQTGSRMVTFPFINDTA